MNHKDEEKMKIVFTNAHHDFEQGLNARAFFKINNKIICGDLVQDTFTKTWNYLLKGGEIILMKAFLYRVLNNLIIDQYRKHKTISLEVLTENGFEIKSNDDEEALINTLDGKNLILLIKYLPIIYQRVMKMRYEQDLSIKEISKLTGISKNSISVQLHRGLEKLKILHNK